ncbi:MAG: TRAP transporter small permease [Pseudomonadota bacterium]|nr:TRAP transporter small permease [Pseudomonadota bacterium]
MRKRALKTLLDGLLRAANRGSLAAALAGGLLVLASAVLVSVDVLLRKFAGFTLGGADELSGYALAIGSTWSFAFVLLNRGNVRIDALYERLPPAVAAVCDLLSLIALLVFVSVVAWYGFNVVQQSARVNAHSNSALAVPLVVPQAMWWAGYAWFVLCAAALLGRSLLALLAADWPAVNRLIGARSISEEAADEAAAAEAARRPRNEVGARPT